MNRPVLIIHDAVAAHGDIDAADVLNEAAAIGQGLVELGLDSAVLPVSLDLAAFEAELGRRAPAVVFNLVESLSGRASLISVVPTLLESLQVPFTGCSATAQWTTSNKLEAKRRLKEAGIATPEWLATGTSPAARGAAAADPDMASSTGPWIVKSVWEHASVGLDDQSVVTDRPCVAAEIERRKAAFGGQWFAERFIDGRELNVGLIATDTGPRALPVAEIVFDRYPADKPRIVGYAAKWHVDSFEYAHTQRSFAVETELAARASAVAQTCWQAFGLSGYARVDLRVDAQGAIYVLEVNANPCLSPDAGFAAMLETDGIGYSTALRWLLDDAQARSHRVRLPQSPMAPN